MNRPVCNPADLFGQLNHFLFANGNSIYLNPFAEIGQVRGSIEANSEAGPAQDER